MELASEWVPWVDKEVTDWVFTIISKADLWWPDNDEEVYRHYNTGDYRDALGNLPILVPHVVLPFCSIIEPFFGKYSIGTLGNTEKQRIHNYFLKTLLSAAAGRD